MIARSDVAGQVTWDATPYHAFNVLAHTSAALRHILCCAGSFVRIGPRFSGRSFSPFIQFRSKP